ncbi:hypothetical protein COCNU_01G015160 [Cocos nucifera]|uniref:RRM domain-containing protein n=1 Tax=Cocos nucifera TaxID=13894 RepID=A0A8K0MV70_COCNU|nr:hypothetical protein COCNU_01G015160 [Cocos nucifera]
MSANNINAVFYADTYHPIQAGSIDGTDTLPHDRAIYGALLCSNAGLYDPFGDPKVIGDPYGTVFVGRLSRQTDEETLRKVMSKYGRVKNLRLVRDIVTGASRGYAFVEYETEREMRRAYEAAVAKSRSSVNIGMRVLSLSCKDAHHSIIDDSEVIVDYYRQQLMPGWIPRRLGGGLGGRKESGQLRFGGRERPFRAPLRPIPYDDLKRLGIPPPPEGRYMSRFEDCRCVSSKFECHCAGATALLRFHHPLDGEAAMWTRKTHHMCSEDPKIGKRLPTSGKEVQLTEMIPLTSTVDFTRNIPMTRMTPHTSTIDVIENIPISIRRDQLAETTVHNIFAKREVKCRILLFCGSMSR